MVQKMKFEHVAINVPDPVNMAKWYVENCGLKAVIALQEPPFTHFLTDSEGGTAIEIYNNTEAPVPDYFQQSHFVYHNAFVASDLDHTKERLINAGATYVEQLNLPNQTRLIMLRDPWGIALQLVDRKDPWY